MIKFGDKLKEELRRAEPDKERLYSMAAEAKPGRSRMRKNLVAALCAAAAVLIVVGACFYTVMSTQRGVRFAYPGEQVSVNSKDYAAVANKIAGLDKYDTYWTGKYGINGGSPAEDGGNIGADAAPMAPAPGSDSQMGDGEKDYSDTNNQVNGVNEGDIVKTDGSYIYCLSRDRDGIFIFRVLEDGKLETESVTALDEESFKDKNGNSYSRRVSAMQLWNDRLAVIYSVSGSGSKILWQSSMTRTEIIVYDIADRRAPTAVSRLSQSGTMLTSRMVNGYLYVVGEMTVYSDYDKDDVYTYVPSVEYNGKNQPVNPDEILICEYAHFATYSVLSGIDLRNGQMVSSKAVLGGDSDVYASAERIYLAREVRSGAGGRNTEILRFGCNDGVLSQTVQGSVPGGILNQFSMDDYNGYFRIVTEDIITGGDYRGNGIFILDSGLQTVGSIVDISPDEQIKSVRFDGELCYFVTFRNTDPLFAVDTSVPESPKVLSKLKIPGFSVYLQTYGPDRLLGIGYEADEVSGGTTGLKLSMFDTSDKTNVTELHRLVISGSFYTSAGNEHKGVLADAKKGIVCFPSENGYLVYSYDDADGFAKKGVIEADWGFIEDVADMRGLYIGNTLYVLCGRSIGVYSLENMQRLQSVELG